MSFYITFVVYILLAYCMSVLCFLFLLSFSVYVCNSLNAISQAFIFFLSLFTFNSHCYHVLYFLFSTSIITITVIIAILFFSFYFLFFPLVLSLLSLRSSLSPPPLLSVSLSSPNIFWLGKDLCKEWALFVNTL